MGIRLLIVEDNPITAMDLRELLEATGYEVIGTEAKAEGALVTTLSQKPDVLVVDIKLAGKMDGIEMVRLAREAYRCPVIYLTANSDTQTVERALETSPSAFITKPFQDKDVKIAVDLAFKNFTRETLTDTDKTLPGYVFLKSGNTYKKVDTNEITHLEAQGSYCTVYTTSEKHTLSGNLSHFICETGPCSFVRVHRSHAVNIDHIDKVDNDYIYIGDKALPIGPSYKTGLKAVIRKLS